MGKILYGEILDALFPFKELRDHLKKQELDLASLVNLILGSVMSLEQKLEWCRRLYEIERNANLAKVIYELDRALSHLENGTDGIFTIEENCVPWGTMREEHILACPGKKRCDIEYSIIASDDECFPWNFPAWWEVAEWNTKKHGCGEYEYLFCKTEGMSVAEPVFYRHCNSSEVSYSPISIPFEPGDILRVEGLPFESTKDVLLLRKNSCQQLALTFDENGNEKHINLADEFSWLNNRHSFDLASYYRMRSSDGSLLNNEQLKQFQSIAIKIRNGEI